MINETTLPCFLGHCPPPGGVGVLTSRRSQPPLALSVPLSRFTPRVGGGSAFYVRRLAASYDFTSAQKAQRVRRGDDFRAFLFYCRRRIVMLACRYCERSFCGCLAHGHSLLCQDYWDFGFGIE